MKENFLDAEMKKTMLKLYILRQINTSKMNAYAMLKEASSSKRAKKFFKSETEMKNEVYNTIKSLEKSNYISASQKVEKGRAKTYYTLTKKGNAVLKSARKMFIVHIKELSSIFS